MTPYKQAYEPKKHKKDMNKIMSSNTHAASQIGDSAAAGALWESAGREGLCGGLELDIDLVASVADLIDPEPRKLYLNPHARHTADGAGLDDAADAGAVPKL